MLVERKERWQEGGGADASNASQTDAAHSVPRGARWVKLGARGGCVKCQGGGLGLLRFGFV
jgi:hypothetical protein